MKKYLIYVYIFNILIIANTIEQGKIIIKAQASSVSIFSNYKHDNYIGCTNSIISLLPGKYSLIIENEQYISTIEVEIIKDQLLEIDNLTFVKKTTYYNKLKKNKLYELDSNKSAYAIDITYLIFSIFPITNLTGYSYCSHPIILLGFHFLLPLVVLIPSLISEITGFSLFGYSGWKYFIDNQNEDYRSYFIASVVCVGVSYLLNLIPLVVVFCISPPSFIFGNKDVIMNNKTLEILRNLIIGLKNTSSSFQDLNLQIGYNIKL